VFCQNWDISQQPVGSERPPEQIADLMMVLQAGGCHNINFVTPEHVVPQVIEAVAAAIPRGLNLPIVYNTSAYDAVASLKLLEGLVDIYLPDFKFWTYESARRYVKAKDYPERATEAITEMHRQVGVLKFGRDGLAKRGVLARHLVMPGQTQETAAICSWLADELSPDTYINLMGQYRLEFQVGAPGKDSTVQYVAINRRPSDQEMAQASAVARKAGLWRFDERRARARFTERPESGTATQTGRSMGRCENEGVPGSARRCRTQGSGSGATTKRYRTSGHRAACQVS